MITRNHRPATLLCLICLALALATMTGVQLIATSAEPSPARGLELTDVYALTIKEDAGLEINHVELLPPGARK